MIGQKIKYGFLIGISLIFLGLSNDGMYLNPAQRVSFQDRYSLIEWEAHNLLSKWIHLLEISLPWNQSSKEERIADVLDYYRLQWEIKKVQDQLVQASVRTNQKSLLSVKKMEIELAQLKKDSRKLRDNVEEVLEASISSALKDAGLESSWGFIFPPVDFRLTEPPLVLVASPRNRIERKYDVILHPNITMDRRNEIEETLKDSWNLSALVIEIGGVATYPAIVLDTRPLNSTLETAAHEWVHHYLFFRALGRNMFSSSEMQTLNETFASIVGQEIGSAAYKDLGIIPEHMFPKLLPRTDVYKAENGTDIDEFSFVETMRDTRLLVDELLTAGMIEEAEEHMSDMRDIFVQEGFNVRKLNQAYFAFHGTYAESPTSASPIGAQLRQLRGSVADLRTFVEIMKGISDYEEFLEKLAVIEKTSVAKNSSLY